MENLGNKRAKKVLSILDNYDKAISTVLVGNNIVNILSASLATVLFVSFFSAQNEGLAVTLSTVVMTVLVLIFGEVTPKSMAREAPEKFAMLTLPIMRFHLFIFTPFNAFFVLWKKMLSKVFKFKKGAAFTDEELITIVETAESEGGITEHESELIRSAIEFEDLKVEEIMVPRVNVIAIEEHMPLSEIAETFAEHGFSRLPVYSGTIDSIIGIMHEKDFHMLQREQKTDILPILQNSICVSPSMSIAKVLRIFQKAKVHMAVVVDEFGGTEGIVTIEDVLEELVGEIWDEHDEVEVLYKKIDHNTFLVSGNENLENMFEEMGVKTKMDFDSTSVGGWVTEMLQKIPVAGERFSFDVLDVSVTKANLKRVLEVKIKVNEKENED